MKDLDQQNKKLRGFLKIYNNLLTKLIKKSNKADLLGTAKENTEFKHRSKDKLIKTLKRELENLDKLISIK